MTHFQEDFETAMAAVNNLFESHVADYRTVESELHDREKQIEVLRQERDAEREWRRIDIDDKNKAIETARVAVTERDEAVENARRLRLELRAIKKTDAAGGCAMEELKPCPFCGGPAVLVNGFVGCRKCGIRTREYISGHESRAVTDWNNRVDHMKSIPEPGVEVW